MDGHLTQGTQPQTRQATPECTCPIRGSGSQTSYPRVQITRQAMLGVNESTPLDKRGCRNPVESRTEEEKESIHHQEEIQHQNHQGNTNKTNPH